MPPPDEMSRLAQPFADVVGPLRVEPLGMHEDNHPRPGMREFKYIVPQQVTGVRVEFTLDCISAERLDRIVTFVEAEMAAEARARLHILPP